MFLKKNKWVENGEKWRKCEGKFKTEAFNCVFPESGAEQNQIKQGDNKNHQWDFFF